MNLKRTSTFLAVTVALAFFSSCESNDLLLCFTADSQTPKTMQRVKFTAACSKNVEIYHWNFGDGVDTVTTKNSVEHVFVEPGSYYVTLHNTRTEIVDHCPPNGGGTVASTLVEVVP